MKKAIILIIAIVTCVPRVIVAQDTREEPGGSCLAVTSSLGTAARLETGTIQNTNLYYNLKLICPITREDGSGNISLDGEIGVYDHTAYDWVVATLYACSPSGSTCYTSTRYTNVVYVGYEDLDFGTLTITTSPERWFFFIQVYLPDKDGTNSSEVLWYYAEENV